MGWYQTTVSAFGYTSCTLSFIGTLFIIVSYNLMDGHYTLSKFVLWLSVSDLLSATTLIIQLTVTLTLNHPLSDTIYTFLDCIWYVFVCIGLHNSAFIALYHFRPGPTKWMPAYQAIAWCLPSSVAIILFVVFGYEPNKVDFGCVKDDVSRVFSGYCDSKPMQGMLASFFFIIWFFNIGTYVSILYQRRERDSSMDTLAPVGREQMQSVVDSTSRKVTQYIIIFLVCFTPLFLSFTLNRIAAQHDLVRVEKIVTILCSIFVPLQGFLNAVTYGLNFNLVSYFLEYGKGYRGLRDVMSSTELYSDDYDEDRSQFYK